MLKNYPLRDLNTWQVGGNCAMYFAPRSFEEFRTSYIEASQCGNMVYVLGGGSNVLVCDGLLPAYVLHTEKLDSIKLNNNLLDDTVELDIEPGYPVIKLLELAINIGVGGLEFLVGIPGTVGGAIWGNAGASGVSFEPLIKHIETIDTDGNKNVITAENLTWKYRTCPIQEEDALVITKCSLLLHRKSKSQIFSDIRRFSELKKGQPLGRKTAGCVFKNPKGNSAGKLLDEVGCKGLRFGGAVVSSYHANFIENVDNATAQDIYNLSEECRNRVLLQFGVKLEYEIKFFGTFEKN